MPEPVIPTSIRNGPKIDLHRHLLGSITADILLKVAREHAHSIPYTISELEDLLVVKEPVDGLQPFFKAWPFLSKFMTSPDIISSMVRYVLEDAHNDNVIYTELRVGWGMTGRESFSVKEFLGGIQKGLLQAEKDFGIIGRVIFGITRHLFAHHASWQRQILWTNIVEAVNEYKNSVVVGFDLSGIEEKYPANLFLEEFQQIKKMGLPITIHCGETVGAQDIWATINTLKPSRISHALSSVIDDSLLKQLSQSQIPVEICFTTNWLTKTVSNLAEHPVKKMHSNGVKIVITTDNPAICRTTLSKEYALLISQVGFTISDINQFIENSLSSIFGDDFLQQSIREKFLSMGGKCLD
ncbi:MAG: adenosine deaminase [Nitrospirae bacterium]|nr:adenosine deaminase [Nitrospirota bacterium]